MVRGTECEVSALWLRLHEPAGFTHNGQRLFEISDVVQDPGSSTVASSHTTDTELQVEFGDGRLSSFPMEWLAQQLDGGGVTDGAAVQDAAVARVPTQQLWGAEVEDVLPWLSYADFSSSDAGKLRLCNHLERYGIAVRRQAGY
jgi:hypothetical protein